jgi:hypothetical protein
MKKFLERFPIVKTPIKSIIGLHHSCCCKTNDQVAKGKRLFSIKTKESIALGNDVNKLDSKLNFELQFQFDLVLMALSRQLM